MISLVGWVGRFETPRGSLLTIYQECWEPESGTDCCADDRGEEVEEPLGHIASVVADAGPGLWVQDGWEGVEEIVGESLRGV